MKIFQMLLIIPAAFGLLCAALLLSGQWPEGLGGGAEAPEACDCTAIDDTRPEEVQPSGAATDGAPLGANAGASASDSLELQRFSVCERQEHLPKLQRLGEGQWLVHCGASAHLIAFEPAGAQLVPRRIATLEVGPGSGGPLPHPGPARMVDLGGSGARDLLVSTLRLDGTSLAVGGEVYRAARTATGALAPPERLFSIIAGALLDAELNGEAPRELIALQLGNRRTQQPAEVWTFDGGPAPQRRLRYPAPASSSALAALDLDGDGMDDLAVAAPDEGRVALWLSSQRGDPQHPRLQPTHVIERAGARQLLTADLDGDGKDALLVVGDGIARVTLAQPATEAPRVQPLQVEGSIRDAHMIDVDADGRPELVAYGHPTLQVLSTTGATRELMRLQGESSAVVTAQAAHLDADGRWDLLVLSVGDAIDGVVELAVARGQAGARAARFARTVTPLRDAPLSLKLSLP